LDGIVISVGNLTVGGTGKTPMVLWIAERLLAEGKGVGILTQGYRAKSAPSGSEESSTGCGWASDEVQLLKTRLGDRVSFGVGADRFRRGRGLAAQGVKWFILDDGFQHLQLARDVDIVLIDATNPFGGGHLLPAGRLRESRTALERADLVVTTRSGHAPALEAAVRRDSEAPIFYARPRLDSIRAIHSESANKEEERTPSQKVFAFCGVGNPHAFLSDLRDWGFQVAGHRFFPDHHRYSQRDVDEIETEARAAGIRYVICTEKDVFNISGLRWHASDVWYCRISLQVDREDSFWRSIIDIAESGSMHK
jgi:tetraacyldisaccharide 4'-kinase